MSTVTAPEPTVSSALVPSTPSPLAMQPAGAQSALLQTETFNQMQRVAIAIGGSSLCPKHLKGSNQSETVGNCLRVVNQAYRWGFDPFAVADESYVVHGKLGYQGKLVAAVVNSRAGLKERLAYDFKGEGDERTVIVSATFQGSEKVLTIELSVKQAKTENDMWKKDPDQKLCYSGAIKWARRYCPEVIMGVLTDDDLERMSAPSAPAEPVAPTTLNTLADKILNKPETNDANGEKPESTGEPLPDWLQGVLDKMVMADEAGIEALLSMWCSPGTKLPTELVDMIQDAAAKRLDALGVVWPSPEAEAEPSITRDYEAEIAAAPTVADKKVVLGEMQADEAVAPDRLAIAQHAVKLAEWGKTK